MLIKRQHAVTNCNQMLLIGINGDIDPAVQLSAGPTVTDDKVNLKLNETAARPGDSSPDARVKAITIKQSSEGRVAHSGKLVDNHHRLRLILVIVRTQPDRGALANRQAMSRFPSGPSRGHRSRDSSPHLVHRQKPPPPQIWSLESWSQPRTCWTLDLSARDIVEKSVRRSLTTETDQLVQITENETKVD